MAYFSSDTRKYCSRYNNNIITVNYMALFQVDQSSNTILILEINEFLVFS